MGLGLAMYVEVCGIGPSATLPTGGWEYAQVTVERDGRISATTGASPHGQGNETTFAQMLADQFGVPLDHVTILHGDTAVVKQGIGTFGSRSQAVGGTALHMAGIKAKTQDGEVRRGAARGARDDLVFEDGTSRQGRARAAKSFADVAGFAYVPVPLPEGLEPGLSEEAFFEPTNNTYPFGCHISMLEIDRDTGEPSCSSSSRWTMREPDQSADRRGQIHGGLAQGIGQAMIEEAVYDEDGQLMTGSFMDYAMPRAIDFPRFELDITVTPTPVNPLGAKGVGEAGTLGSTPCIVSAAVDALSEFGVKHIDMMLRPEKLWRIIQAEARRDPDRIRLSAGHVAGRCAGEASGGDGGASCSPAATACAVMKLRLSEPALLIDIARIPGLAGIREADGKIEIGAGTAHRDVATSRCCRRLPDRRRDGGVIGDPQVRNRGTFGGSLAHADPAADFPAVMLALDAEIHLKGANGWRMVKATTSSRACSPWIWQPTRSSPPCGSRRSRPRPTRSCIRARRTTRSSASRRRSTSRAASSRRASG